MPEETVSGRSRDSVSNTLVVALTLSLVCSVLVASAAVLLKPRQALNEETYRQRIILDVAGLPAAAAGSTSAFEDIEVRMVELQTGSYTDEFGADGFDALAAAKDSELGVAIPAGDDIAGIRRRSRVLPVYLVRDDGVLTQVILPVYGAGLWSTMYGFLSVDANGNTIRALRFYEHAETPGLGDQIDRPAWRAEWRGKQIRDESGAVRIEVIRGTVIDGADGAVHQVDGIAGATLTGRGVTNLVRYWVGPHGFGPFLENLQRSTRDE